jgi:branched-chain amino acid transport system substrate-binding protein
MKPAGFENGQGIISATYLKDATDAQWNDDPGMKRFDAFLAKYDPKANRDDVLVLTGYSAAQSLVHVLKACGDDLTRANVMKQAASMKDVELDGLLPGIKMNTSADDFGPIQDLQLIRFKGESWERFGDVISGRVSPGTN